ncbi:MAG: Jag N-terminal domain-containing protein [Candidatus Binatia bacterium]
MADSVEAQGITVDEAIQIALNQLGVSRDRVEIEILKHPRSGLLGLGARRAKVRATLRAGVMEDGQEYDMSVGSRRRRGRRRRRGSRSPSRQDDGSNATSQGAAGNGAAAKEARGDGRRRKDGQARGERGRQDNQGRGDRRARDGGRQGRAGQEGARRERGPGQDRRDRGRPKEQSGGKNAEPAQTSGGEGAATQSPARRESRDRGAQASAERDRREGEAAEAGRAQAGASRAPAEARVASEEELRRYGEGARALAAELLERMGFEARVDTDLNVAENEVVLKVNCEEALELIGKRAQGLDALEHLLNRMMHRGESGGELRLAVDIGDYRERRGKALELLAANLALRAVEEKRSLQLAPMSPRDRRIFQGAMAKREEVRTRVLGTGFYRRIRVTPQGEAGESPDVQSGDGQGYPPDIDSHADEAAGESS